MSELRFNPLTRDWVIIASHRQDRPQMPKDYCPFCPGSGKVPAHYTVHQYDNDYPALSPDFEEAVGDIPAPYRAKAAYGKCEVILYTSDHNAALSGLPDGHMAELADLWRDRFEALSGDERVKYVMIFENRGEEIGVTMPHPHGQIYAYSYLPKKLELELQSAGDYLVEKGNCLFCDMLGEELGDGRRVVFKTAHFTVFLPYFCEYPYGVYIFSNRHADTILNFTEEERRDLGRVVRDTAGLLDALFGFPFPYMMCMHNAPVNLGTDTEACFHFHIEFFSPVRSADKLKYNASSETGAWAHCNPTCPEEKAAELRAAYERYIAGRP